MNVEVETGSDLTMGQTVVDWWGVTGRPRNATFIREGRGVLRALTERIGGADPVSDVKGLREFR